MPFRAHASQIQTHAGAARGVDANALRKAMTKAFQSVRLPGQKKKIKKISDAEFEAAGSVNLGPYHLCTARLLVDINRRDEFDQAPSTCDPFPVFDLQ